MNPVDHLIEQYWAGKATVSEIEQLHRYMHTARPELSFDDFELFLDNVDHGQAGDSTIDDHARHVLYSIKQKAGILMQVKGKTRNFKSAGFAMAACILIAAFIFLPWLLQRNDLSQKEPKRLTQISYKDQQASKSITNTGRTILDTVLPDHSKVSLFPNSSLVFADGFEPHARRVSMQGKVRFHVAKDKNRVFQVWAGGLVTTAIGTVFEINTERRDQTGIRLIEGKISVKRTGREQADSVILLAGQSLVYLPRQNQIRLSKGVNISPAADAGSELVFNQLPLALVFRQLEMEYGIVIEYDAPPSDIRISARFRKQAGPGKIISEIVVQNKLTMQHSGGVYSIK